MNVLVMTAHPDDMEISCAGTLIKCVNRGDKVTVCHVCNGNMGHMIIPPDELRSIRRDEARTSGDMAGIEVITCDIGDLMVNSGDLSQRDKIIEVIKNAEPDFIITHSPTDYMPDHLAVQQLVFSASFASSCPQFGAKGIAKLTPLYYMDNLAGMSFQPTEYVDISDEMTLKLEMLECHVSQLKWMREHDNIDFADFVRTCSKFRGLQCGVKYAEAFTNANVWPRATTKRLLP